MFLGEKQRKDILASVRKRVLNNHFNVAGIDYKEWTTHVDDASVSLLSGDLQRFEAGIQELLKELRSSHTGFYHERPSRLFPQHTINATLGKWHRGDQQSWFFLDVFEGGPAHQAGIRPGQLLLEVDAIAYAPPDMPPFRTGTTHKLTICSPDASGRQDLSISVPGVKGKKDVPPILPPKAIFSSMAAPGVGILRITWFPGAMGLGFSKALDSAIGGFKDAQSLIIDLRGNIGGGLGFARLASYLCPDKRPIGYSMTPKRLRRGFEREELERVVYPSSRAGFARTLTRFALRDKSIFLLTQGLGPQPFHGNIIILVNEWTNSAAEMLASFASQEKLATIIGTKTAGNVLGAVNSKVGHGYWLRLPVFGWYSLDGKCVEGSGINPDISIEPDPVSLSIGVDRQLNAALEALSSPSAFSNFAAAVGKASAQ